MKIKSIQTKIALAGSMCLIIAGMVVVGYSTFSSRTMSIKAAENQAKVSAKLQAASIQAKINAAMDTSRILANVLSTIKDTQHTSPVDRESISAMLFQILKNNPSFLGTYTGWEPNEFDGKDREFANKPGHDETGRFIPYWVKNDKGEIQLEPLKLYDVEGDGDYYLLPKKNKTEAILDPFVYNAAGKDILMTSLVVPILVNGKFYGICGVDLALDFLQSQADSFNLYDGTAKLILVSYTGIVSGMTGNPTIAGKKLSEVHSGFEKNLETIQKGIEKTEYSHGNLEVIVPIKIGLSSTPWSVIVQIPEGKITEESLALMWKQISLSILFVFLALTVFIWIAKTIATPLKTATHFAISVSEGDLTQQITIKQDDEIGHLASALNQMTKNLNTIMSQINQAAEQVASSSEELSATLTKSFPIGNRTSG